MDLILGSQSPRRKEILQFFNLPFTQVSPDFDEESHPFQGDPEEYVLQLAKGKADSLAHQYPQAMILTADTIVHKKGKIYGKPSTPEEALQFLTELSGEWHQVFTGLTLSVNGEDFQAHEETRVLFNALTEEQIHLYHQVLPISDKAGGYMIQGAGSLIVKRIDGCYYNVMGLPVNGLAKVLQRAGVDLWHYLKREK